MTPKHNFDLLPKLLFALSVSIFMILLAMAGCQKMDDISDTGFEQSQEKDEHEAVDKELIKMLPKPTSNWIRSANVPPLFDMCQCEGGLTGEAEGLENNYKLYRKAVIINNSQAYQEFYIGAIDYTKFSAYVGGPAPDIYDFDSDGKVATSDLLPVLSGWGNQPDSTYDLCSVGVDFVNSHGWPSSYPGAYLAIVYTTQFDEEGDGIEMCPLNTFRLELVYQDSSVYLWYH